MDRQYCVPSRWFPGILCVILMWERSLRLQTLRFLEDDAYHLAIRFLDRFACFTSIFCGDMIKCPNQLIGCSKRFGLGCKSDISKLNFQTWTTLNLQWSISQNHQKSHFWGIESKYILHWNRNCPTIFGPKIFLQK